MAESGRAYQEAVGNASFYSPGSVDHIRPNMPFTPVYQVDTGGKPTVPLVGVLILVGIVFLFEHLRKGR